MPEAQNVEYKQNWHDDYLKWIVGFANANGGTIYIGKDDRGKVVGLQDYKKLLEDLPNKVWDKLGVMVEVNLGKEGELYYIEIQTPRYAIPISLRGAYYYRSGSTNQELKGNALVEFLLRKSGKTWDDIIEPSASLNDIDESSIKHFIQDAGKSGRLPEVEGLTLLEILGKLRLLDEEKIKRAAIVLFGKDPGRFFPNMIVKIGRFGTSDDDLRFQEVIEGNLIRLLKEVPEQLNHKFFTKSIDFEGLLRIEKGEYPTAALREMLLNALVHRNYMGSMVQIRVYDNHFSIWNEGTLPEGITIDALKRQHYSRPRNPIIADVCFKAGYIDVWGRGTLKIYNSCKEAGLPEPAIAEQDGGLLVTLFKDIYQEEWLSKLGLNERQIKAVLFAKENGSINNAKYVQLVKVSRQTATRDLAELVSKFNIFTQRGAGAGSVYILN